MQKSMFDVIKKQNGERFAKAIRNYDNGIFDIPHIDKIVKYAGREAEPIMNYLVSLKNIRIEEMSVHRNPIDLLAEAGYDAYVADTLEKQNAIKKYFEHDEELCTFRDPSRFENYYIINAVRKDVDKIKRSPNPQREDKYGTSVISIQILKSGGFISIKNRYNHTVDNPDNTLNSNPDNIIPGLSDAIKHYFNVDFSAQRNNLPNNYILVGEKIFKYIAEYNNIYFGEDSWVENKIIREIDKDKEFLIPQLSAYLDLQHNELVFITNDTDFEDVNKACREYVNGKKIRIVNAPGQTKLIYMNDKLFAELRAGEIKKLDIPEMLFLAFNTKLKGDIDVSKYVYVALDTADLTDAEIKFGNNMDVSINNCSGLHGRLDFTNVSEAVLLETDLSLVDNIDFRDNGEYINGIKISEITKFKIKNAAATLQKKIPAKPKVSKNDQRTI